MKDIAADRGWQNTGILLEADETIHIQFMSGEIRDGDAIIRGLAGAGWICGDSSCCEPMPYVERDALIGRGGDRLFPMGTRIGLLCPQAENCNFGLMIVMRDSLIIPAALLLRFHIS